MERAAIMQLLSGYWYAQALHVVARLGVADALATGPAPVAELARRCGAHAPSLHRLMRALAAIGVFSRAGTDRYANNPMSDCLRADVQASLRPAAIFGGDSLHWRAWEGLYEAVRDGHTAFDHVHGQPLFAALAGRPELMRTFQGLMSGGAAYNDAILDACQLDRARLLVDVGGGHGQLARAALERWPALRAVVADRPEVVASQDDAERLSFVAADFFESLPAGGDCYLLRFILHDWDDPPALAILRTCRRAMAPGGRLLVIEHLLAEQGGSTAALLDVSMMVLTGGRERSQRAYGALFEAAGFALERAVPTDGGLVVLSAVALAERRPAP